MQAKSRSSRGVGDVNQEDVMETKAFPTGDVLSIATDVFVTPNGIGAVYEVLNWMTGESVYTHQIPRIGREAAPVLLAAHPELAIACVEAKHINFDNWQKYLAIWVARYGETIEVPKFMVGQHERTDPIAELAKAIRPNHIIAVEQWKDGMNEAIVEQVREK